MIEAKDANRFMSKVSIPDSPNACWEWMGYVNRDGYGRLKLKYKTAIAHRVSFELFNLKTPGRWEFICHSCDNKTCVNPAHLWLGTPKENTHDMISKNRHHYMSMKTCRAGHSYTSENTYLWNNKRICRTCRKENALVRKAGITHG